MVLVVSKLQSNGGVLASEASVSSNIPPILATMASESESHLLSSSIALWAIASTRVSKVSPPSTNSKSARARKESPVDESVSTRVRNASHAC